MLIGNKLKKVFFFQIYLCVFLLSSAVVISDTAITYSTGKAGKDLLVGLDVGS